MNLQELKKKIENNLSIKIDFRQDVHTPSANGATPVMSFIKAESVIEEAFEILGVDPLHNNVSIILGKMETSTLKHELEVLLFESSIK